MAKEKEESSGTPLPDDTFFIDLTTSSPAGDKMEVDDKPVAKKRSSRKGTKKSPKVVEAGDTDASGADGVGSDAEGNAKGKGRASGMFSSLTALVPVLTFIGKILIATKPRSWRAWRRVWLNSNLESATPPVEVIARVTS